MVRTDSLYQRVISITTDYLGPASQRFVDRQIQSHLGKQPSELTRHDLIKFMDWSRIALAVLTDDQKLVEEYINRLVMLYEKRPAKD